MEKPYKGYNVAIELSEKQSLGLGGCFFLYLKEPILMAVSGRGSFTSCVSELQ